MKDISGQVFGRLTATTYTKRLGWTCVCACGGSRTAQHSDLQRGAVKSCGCISKTRPDKRTHVTTGERYGRITIVSETAKEGEFRMFDVRCDCGNTTNVRLNGLRTGNTKSCGCLVKETSGNLNKTHGLSGTPTYSRWQAMLTRATNPQIKGAKHYALRGITVCISWLKFENFLADMGECPEGLTLDRIDNDRNYCPENCRWATYSEQARNKHRQGGKVKGVNQLPSGRWRVDINTQTCRNFYFGSYDTYQEAVEARQSAERAYWGTVPPAAAAHPAD